MRCTITTGVHYYCHLGEDVELGIRVPRTCHAVGMPTSPLQAVAFGVTLESGGKVENLFVSNMHCGLGIYVFISMLNACC